MLFGYYIPFTWERNKFKYTEVKHIQIHRLIQGYNAKLEVPLPYSYLSFLFIYACCFHCSLGLEGKTDISFLAIESGILVIVCVYELHFILEHLQEIICVSSLSTKGEPHDV